MAFSKTSQIKNNLLDLAVTAGVNLRLVQNVMKSAPEDVKNRPIGYAVPLCCVANTLGENTLCKYKNGIYVAAYTGSEETTAYDGFFSKGGYWFGGYGKSELINGMYTVDLPAADKELKKSMGNDWKLLAFIVGSGEEEAANAMPRTDDASNRVIKALKDMLSGKTERQTAALSYYFLPATSLDIIRTHADEKNIVISTLCYDDTISELMPLKINCQEKHGKILMHRTTDRPYVYVKKWGIIRGEKLRVTEYFNSDNGCVTCTDNADQLYEGMRAMIPMLNGSIHSSPYYISLPEGRIFISHYMD